MLSSSERSEETDVRAQQLTVSRTKKASNEARKKAAPPLLQDVFSCQQEGGMIVVGLCLFLFFQVNLFDKGIDGINRPLAFGVREDKKNRGG
jgi:hypothetical protein